eukprot:190264-Pyramimonas_sp.AAC.1
MISRLQTNAIKIAHQRAMNEAKNDPDHIWFFMLWDFHMSEHPARSLAKPIDAHATERYQRHPTSWGQLFRSMAEHR